MSAVAGTCALAWPDSAGPIALVAAVSAALAALTCFLAERHLRRDLAALRRALTAAARGDLSKRLRSHRGGETEKLIAAFNEMSDNLQLRLAQHQHVLEQTQRMEKLALLGEALGQGLHDICSPLDAAQDGLRLLRSHLHNDPHLQQIAEMISAALRRTELAAKSLSAISRDFPAESRPADLTKIAQESLRMLSHRIRQQNVRLEQDYPPGPVTIIADENLLTLGLANLVKNALDAMPHGGSLRVTVGLSSENGKKWAKVEIADTGCGIPPDDLDRIFEPLFTTKPKHLGTGLGLSAARRIIERHGGRISVRSQLERGTCFTVYLPTQAPENAKNSPTAVA